MAHSNTILSRRLSVCPWMRTSLILVSCLLLPVNIALAETGLPESEGEQFAGSENEKFAEAEPDRLIPHWTNPRRAANLEPEAGSVIEPEPAVAVARSETPELAKAVTSEAVTVAPRPGDRRVLGIMSKPLSSVSMIDIVDAGFFMSPITDENHRAWTIDLRLREQALPESEGGFYTEAVAVSNKSPAVKSESPANDWTRATRIVVHSQDKNQRLPSKLHALLRSEGALSVESHEIELAVDRNHIRFFHESDHMHAMEVAAALDGVLDTLLVKDFSSIRPQPSKGLVEIWLR